MHRKRMFQSYDLDCWVLFKICLRSCFVLIILDRSEFLDPKQTVKLYIVTRTSGKEKQEIM